MFTDAEEGSRNQDKIRESNSNTLDGDEPHILITKESNLAASEGGGRSLKWIHEDDNVQRPILTVQRIEMHDHDDTGHGMGGDVVVESARDKIPGELGRQQEEHSRQDLPLPIEAVDQSIDSKGNRMMVETRPTLNARKWTISGVKRPDSWPVPTVDHEHVQALNRFV